MADNKEEDILYYEGDIPIKKNNRFNLNLNQYEMVKLAKVINQTGLSVPKIIALLSQPCCKCGNDNVTLTIPKGILSTNKGNNGGNLLTKHETTRPDH